MTQFSDKKIIRLPMLPMRNIVVFPHMTTPFFIGRPQSIEALEEALANDRRIFVIAQKDPMVEQPRADDLYEIGTIGNILQIMRLPNGTIKALFEAQGRGRCDKLGLDVSAYHAEVEVIEQDNQEDLESLTITKSVKDELKSFLKRVSKGVDSTEKILSPENGPGDIADLIAPLLTLDIAKQQELLDEVSSKRRLELVYSRMMEEKENKKLELKLKERVQGQIGRTQKEYYLNEQMKAIQKELGAEDAKAENDEYEDKIKACGMTESAQAFALKELGKLKQMQPMSSEANIVRTFIDWLTSVPWSEASTDNLSVDHAQEVLDEDHYGLVKIKERIVEYLAVANMVGGLRGPILCLVGPPGVGKTSLARSIGRALERKFVRLSLGGVRDEAEIRGHRRTYIGAMPGKIVQSMKKAKVNNPVMLLDEIDKLGQSHMGDPASALLEVLDPEQNKEFMDHYLEVEYDLSQVMFICTANSFSDIPGPLRDRLEVIELSGYTEVEKFNIAKNYLVPRQSKEHGLDSEKLIFDDQGIYEIIRHHTKEAGVRNLERKIAKVCRKAVTTWVKGKKTEPLQANPELIADYLGVRKFDTDSVDLTNEVGVVNGLAWTSVGGEVLTIEVNCMKGSGKIQLTGKLGDVMKESAAASLSFIRANANSLGIYSKVFADLDIHVHVPEGATPKDGPSAGVAITSALVSALTGIPIQRSVAMTGEITLRGKVLPIGGLKEKLLAAKRNKIYQILIPQENAKDLLELEDEVTEGLNILPMKHVRDVLEMALERRPETVDDKELAGEESQSSLEPKHRFGADLAPSPH